MLSKSRSFEFVAVVRLWILTSTLPTPCGAVGAIKVSSESSFEKGRVITVRETEAFCVGARVDVLVDEGGSEVCDHIEHGGVR